MRKSTRVLCLPCYMRCIYSYKSIIFHFIYTMICPLWCNIQVYFLCMFEASKQGIKIYKVDNTLCSKKWFDLDLWTCDLKINRDHILIEGSPCTKFGIDQVKGLKDIERTTHWPEKSGLTLTFEHVTLKINRDHLLIEGNPCTKFGIDQVKGSKEHSGLRRVVWPWPLNMWPENQ